MSGNSYKTGHFVKPYLPLKPGILSCTFINSKAPSVTLLITSQTTASSSTGLIEHVEYNTYPPTLQSDKALNNN